MSLHLDSLTALSRRALASAFSRARSSNTPIFAVDGTAGNGHDTLFLAESVGSHGTVWAFDVQESALASTARRLAQTAPAGEPDLTARVRLIHAGHETLGSVLPPSAHGNIHGATFNLGFLPGSDKIVITRTQTTLAALESLLTLMAPGGILSVHCYTGHDGGGTEAEAVARWIAALPWGAWHTVSYTSPNKSRNRETLYLVECGAPPHTPLGDNPPDP